MPSALRPLLAALTLLTLAACGDSGIRAPMGLGTSPTPEARPAAAQGPVTVRHFGSTEFHDGTPLRLFTFTPRAPRPLDERIRLARTEIALDPDCRWGNAPRGVIVAATERQGPAWAETMLAAPVDCGG